MIKNEQTPYRCKNRLPLESFCYSNVDPMDLYCCKSRSLGATCFYSNMEPTRNVNKLRTKWTRARSLTTHCCKNRPSKKRSKIHNDALWSIAVRWWFIGKLITAQRLRRAKLIIRRFCFSKLPWVISECPAPFVDANIAQGWLQTRLNTGTLVLFCQFWAYFSNKSFATGHGSANRL